MRVKANYKNEAERNVALSANSSLRLIEDNIKGKHRELVFTDEPEPVRPKSMAQRTLDLEERITALENHPSIKGGN